MRNRRRSLLALACSVLAMAPALRAHGSQPRFRIGFLAPTTAAGYVTRTAALRQGLRELGYIEGTHIAIEERWAEGEYARLPRLAEDLVRLNVDVIVTTSTPAARAAQQATQRIPIIAVNVADPLAAGLVKSLARPGANITGLANFVGDTMQKQFGLMSAIVPKLSRLGVLLNPANQSMAGLMKTLEAAAERTQVQLLPAPVGTLAGLDAAFSGLAQQRAQALVVLAEPLFFEHRGQVVALAAKGRLPAIYNARQYVESGGLISYGSNIDEIHRYAARYVDRILKGAKPSDLPVEQPSAMELAVNRRTAASLGVTLPREVLVSADKVID